MSWSRSTEAIVEVHPAVAADPSGRTLGAGCGRCSRFYQSGGEIPAGRGARRYRTDLLPPFPMPIFASALRNSNTAVSGALRIWFESVGTAHLVNKGAKELLDLREPSHLGSVAPHRPLATLQ